MTDPNQQNLPIQEDPAVVSGGPLDPTSKEGTPSEGHVVGEITPAAPAPGHKGFTGEFKTFEELSAYTKKLEQREIDREIQTKLSTPQPVVPAAPAAPAAPSAKEKFSDLIYSKPDEAFEIAVQEADRRTQERQHKTEEAQRQQKMFWDGFYEKNVDLKPLEHIVQSIVAARTNEISRLPTAKEVEDFLSKETRKMVDLVRKSTGHTETKLPSGGAVSFGASGEPVAVPSQPPKQPMNFSDQIRRLRPNGKK